MMGSVKRNSKTTRTENRSEYNIERMTKKNISSLQCTRVALYNYIQYIITCKRISILHGDILFKNSRNYVTL